MLGIESPCEGKAVDLTEQWEAKFGGDCEGCSWQ